MKETLVHGKSEETKLSHEVELHIQNERMCLILGKFGRLRQNCTLSFPPTWGEQAYLGVSNLDIFHQSCSSINELPSNRGGGLNFLQICIWT